MSTSDRQIYIQQLEAKITESKTALDKLKEERDQAVQTMQHEEIDNLEEYLDRAHVSLSNLSNSAEEAWHELKDSIDELMERISLSLKHLLGESDDAT